MDLTYFLCARSAEAQLLAASFATTFIGYRMSGRELHSSACSKPLARTSRHTCRACQQPRVSVSPLSVVRTEATSAVPVITSALQCVVNAIGPHTNIKCEARHKLTSQCVPVLIKSLYFC
jgi:hypothetical protein